MTPPPEFSEPRRSFVKKTLATSVSISFAGLIRAHGDETTGTTTTTYDPQQTDVTTDSQTTTYDPQQTEGSTESQSTTYDPQQTEATTTVLSTTSPGNMRMCVVYPLAQDTKVATKDVYKLYLEIDPEDGVLKHYYRRVASIDLNYNEISHADVSLSHYRSEIFSVSYLYASVKVLYLDPPGGSLLPKSGATTQKINTRFYFSGNDIVSEDQSSTIPYGPPNHASYEKELSPGFKLHLRIVGCSCSGLNYREIQGEAWLEGTFDDFTYTENNSKATTPIGNQIGAVRAITAVKPLIPDVAHQVRNNCPIKMDPPP